jgi:serine/threonine protein phosphatase PrpC
VELNYHRWFSDMKTAIVSEQGTRTEMEDAHHLDTNFGGKSWIFGGVYDGHGGKTASIYTSSNLHSLFLELLLTGISPQQAFVLSYEKASEALKQQRSGTVAATFLIQDGMIYAANAGDARIILVSREKVEQLTTDHRLENPEEAKRISKMGGVLEYPYVLHGNSAIMPTRTIGDEYFKPVGVIATPAVNTYTISADDITLITACDGLFDYMNNEEIAEFARRQPEPELLLEGLKKEVLENRLCTDNITMIAIALKD